MYQKFSKFWGIAIIIVSVLSLAWFIRGGHIKLSLNKKEGFTVEAETFREGESIPKNK